MSKLRELSYAKRAMLAVHAAAMRRAIEKRNARLYSCYCGSVLNSKAELLACRRSHNAAPYRGQLRNPLTFASSAEGLPRHQNP